MKCPFEQIDTQPNRVICDSTNASVGDFSATRASSEVDRGPRLVIRGESYNTPHNIQQESHPFSSHTDWLNVSFLLANEDQLINNFAFSFAAVAGQEFARMNERAYGKLNFERTFTVGDTGAEFSIGGQRGRALLSLSGTACKYISKEAWGEIIFLLRDQYDARITRWDGAADDLEGKHSVDWALEQYLLGAFKNGGRKPKSKLYGDWLETSGEGRTFEVGSRENGKLMRIYEKGKQLGDPTSGWVRWELQLGKKGRTIPWEVLILPGQYVAGAYKCTTWISEAVDRIETHQKAKTISTSHLIKYCRHAYGPLIHMLSKSMSPEELIKLLAREGTMSKLNIVKPID